MEKSFDAEKFLDFMLRKKRYPETKDIASWLDCTPRYIQQWCQKNEVKFTLKGGRKYYIWTAETLYKLELFVSRKEDIPPKPPKVKKRRKPRKEKIPWPTIKDIADQIDIKFIKTKKRILYEYTWYSKVTKIQEWCKENNIPCKRKYGRKYFVLTPEIIAAIKDYFKNNIKENCSYGKRW